jgi:hypothetical protein
LTGLRKGFLKRKGYALLIRVVGEKHQPRRVSFILQNTYNSGKLILFAAFAG